MRKWALREDDSLGRNLVSRRDGLGFLGIAPTTVSNHEVQRYVRSTYLGGTTAVSEGAGTVVVTVTVW
jgi:hypothetical protein